MQVKTPNKLFAILLNGERVDNTMKYVMPNIWAGEPNDSPGIGHEFLLWLTGYNMASYYNLTFVHSPFAGSHVVPPSKWHTIGRVDVPVERWEKFLNFGQDELTQQDLPNNIRIVELPKISCHANVSSQQFATIIESNSKSDESILFKCPFNQFTSMRWDTYRNNRFVNRYWKQRIVDPVPVPFKTDKISVGVHIRRCDVTPQRYSDRFLTNAYYRRILEQILKLYPDIDIHIYSDAANISEFPQLVQLPNTTFHLCTDIFETFHSLVSADIYVMSLGAWAVLTAHLSRGIKVTTEWNDGWNRFPSSKYITVNREGNLNLEFLERMVNEFFRKE